MDATNNCTHSQFEIITKLAELVLQNEWAHTKHTSANFAADKPLPSVLVAKKRSQIFEYLLLSAATDSSAPCPSLESLPQCQKVLECGCLDEKMVNNIAHSLLRLSSTQDENNPRSANDADHEASKANLLPAAPFEMPLLCNNRGKPLLTNSFPTTKDAIPFKSIENMRRSVKPLHISRRSNIMLSNIYKLRDSFNRHKEKYFLSSALEESMNRIREPKGKQKRVKINLPLQRKIREVNNLINSNSAKGSVYDKHFISDKNVSNELKWNQDHKTKLDVIEPTELIEHLKKVAAGLQSETFLCSADGVFSIRPNTSLKSVLPETLVNYAQPFMLSGNAFQRLSARTKRPKRFELPMTRTLRHAISIFLTNSRLFLVSQPASNFSELLRSATPTMQLLRRLEQLHINASSALREGESGSKLLSYIWSAIDQSGNNEYQHLLIYLLNALCQTYFNQLQRWLYEGEIDEHHNELFVTCCSEKTLNHRSKEFFDRGFHVRSSMVPGLLDGYEKAILQCGKYNRLLKTYREDHLTFSLKQPDLVVCLSDQELDKMQVKLKLHYNQVLQNTKPFTMMHIFEERKASMKNFANLMQECTQQRIVAWEQHQRELQLKANAEKKIRNKLLQQQWENNQQARLEQKRMNIVHELEFKRECEKMETERLQREKQALEKQLADLPKVKTPVTSSPDDSTCSFVSCLEEINPDETLTEKSDEFSVRQKQCNVESDKHNLNDNASQNRERNMSSEQFKSCQTMVALKQQSTNLTSSEAISNRLRVLNCTEMTTQLPPDMNMNVEELSDLQRNRLRMHHHHEFSSINSNEDDRAGRTGEKHTSKDLQLPLDQDKLHVMSPITLDSQTPMSTTSDLEYDLFKDTTPAATAVVDAANNNIQENQESSMQESCDTDEPLVLTEIVPVPVHLTEENVCKKLEVRLPHLQLPKKPGEQESLLMKSRSGGSSLMTKHYVKQSIVIPVRMHLSFLRNEVLRIFHELKIYDHFLQLRNYFFLLDGDFGTELVCGFLRHIEDGMEPRGICQKGIMDSVLNNALNSNATDCYSSVRTGTDAAELFAENLTLNCSNIPESFDLMNIDMLSVFSLQWKVDWPLNLVINAETIAKYTQIFSHLLKLRHVSCMLDRAYQYLQQMGKQHGRGLLLSPQYRHLQVMRYKLSHFLITLQNHLDTNVFQVAWQVFDQKLRKVESVEELYMRHVEYLKQVAFLSLLNRQSAKFHDSVNTVLVVVLRFCRNLHAQTFVQDNDRQFIHPRYKSLLHDEAEFEKFVCYVIYLAKKIFASGYQDQVLEFVRNLNFNDYYNVSSELAAVSP